MVHGRGWCGWSVRVLGVVSVAGRVMVEWVIEMVASRIIVHLPAYNSARWRSFPV